MTLLQLLKDYPIGDRKEALYTLITDTNIIANTLKTQTQKELADSLGVTQPFISHLAPLIDRLSTARPGNPKEPYKPVYLRTYLDSEGNPVVDRVAEVNGMTLNSELV